MILDCVMYHKDKLTFDLRRKLLPKENILSVVVEATRTHAGTHKELNFPKNHPDYNGFYGVVDLPETDDRWFLENMHRNALTQVIRQYASQDTWVMISDCDEIPNMSTWDGNEGVFSMRHSFYSPYTIHPQRWNGTVLVHSWRFTSPYGPMTAQDCRNFRDLLRPVGTGWHLGWLTDPTKKAQDFAHAEVTADKIVGDIRDMVAPDGFKLLWNTDIPDEIRSVWNES